MPLLLPSQQYQSAIGMNVQLEILKLMCCCVGFMDTSNDGFPVQK